jgi:hypothetical protein
MGARFTRNNVRFDGSSHDPASAPAKDRNTKVGSWGLLRLEGGRGARRRRETRRLVVQRSASLRRLEARGPLPVRRFSPELGCGIAADGRPKTDDDCAGAGRTGEIEAPRWIGEPN